ncbi:LysR family transcriptional regulator [Oxalobacteraceae bacterium A2-2]|jgi:DNA-binding transcriptional LysR family regulator
MADISSSARSLKTRLKTRQLLLLIALDEQRNIHRAAEEMDMTQPAASKQLKELEELLDVQLFERTTRGVLPTVFGEAMIRHARMALANLANAHEDLAALKAGLVGQVNIGAIMTPSVTLLPAAVTRVKQHSPLLRVGIQVDMSNTLIGQLQTGALDFVIGRLLEQQSKALFHYEELASEPLCVVARVGHPLLKEPRLTLQQIASYGWVLSPPGSVLRHKFDLMFRRLGIEPPNNVIETSEIPVISELLHQSDLLHAFPRELASNYARLKIFAILPIDLPCQMDAFGIITRQNQLLSPGATSLLNAIRAVAGEIYPR